MTIKITTRTDHDGRIYATVTSPTISYDGATVVTTSEYRTNRAGEGLWVWHKNAVEWKQIEGTGQFSARDRAHMRRQMRARAAWTP